MSISIPFMSIDQRPSMKWRRYLQYKGSLVEVDKSGKHRLCDDKQMKCEADRTTLYLFDKIKGSWKRSGQDTGLLIRGDLSRLLVQLFSAHCINPDGALSTPRSQENAVQIGLDHTRFKRILDALERLKYIKTHPGDNKAHKTARATPTSKLVQRWVDDEWNSSKLILKDRNKWLMVLKRPKKIVKFEREIEEREVRLYKTELRLQKKERELEDREKILAKKEGRRPSSVKKVKHTNLKEYKPKTIKDAWPATEWKTSRDEFVSASMEYLTAFNKIYKRMDTKVAGRKFGIPPATLYRVFNNNSWYQGGRFYGHPVQQMSGKDRLDILIEGEPVVELDYQSLHITYAYQNVGAELPDYDNNNDLYSVIGHEGLTGDGKLPSPDVMLANGKGALRVIKKKLFLIALNAGTDNKAVGGACHDLRLEPKLDGLLPERDVELSHLLKQLLVNIKKTHKTIASQLGSGKGVLFQHTDSQIMEKVLRIFLLELGIPIIPVHDSILIPEKYQNLGVAVLKLAHLEEGGEDVGVTCDSASSQKGVVVCGSGLTQADEIFRKKALSAICLVLPLNSLCYEDKTSARSVLAGIWNIDSWKEAVDGFVGF